MVRDDSAQRSQPEDIVAVPTRRGDVVWSRGPRRVTLSTPCAIDPTGVTLYRWPMRSVFIPLERLDRFDVAFGARRDARGRVRTPRPPHPRREDNSRSDDQVAERVAWTAASGERSPTTTSCRPGVRRGRATLKPRERGSELPPITRIAPALGRSGRRCAGEPASMMWCGGWVTTRPDRDPSGGPTGLPTRPATTSHAIDSAPHLAVWSTAVNARPDRPTTAPTGMLLPVRSSG